ncbi:MAG: hypothetical protein ACE5JG_03585 [Planctomycetota bacterium]
MARYPEYADLPGHIKRMLRAVTSNDDAAERYFHAPNKHLEGRTLCQVVNSPFGQRVAERFLVELGRYLAVDDGEIERFKASLGKKR